MREELQAILDRALAAMCEQIDPDHGLLRKMLSKGILSAEQVESCQTNKTRPARVEEMVRYMKLREDDDYEKFRQILKIDREQFVNEHLPPAGGSQCTATDSTIPTRCLLTLKAGLRKCMDPDFGLVDNLLSSVISHKQLSAVKSLKSYCERNDQLLEYLSHENDEMGIVHLTRALMTTKQEHVVNYITFNGVSTPKAGDVWPLSDDVLRFIDFNYEHLSGLIRQTGGLIVKMSAASCINSQHKLHIESFVSIPERNKQLLDIMRRRSRADMAQFARCLLQTGHPELFDLLDKAKGVIACLKAELQESVIDVKMVEEGIARRFLSYTKEKCSHVSITPLVKLIGLRLGNSINVYLAMEAVSGLNWLHTMYTSQRMTTLMPIIKSIFVSLADTEQSVGIKDLLWDADDYKRCAEFFNFPSD